jgi:hypothetical protein
VAWRGADRRLEWPRSVPLAHKLHQLRHLPLAEAHILAEAWVTLAVTHAQLAWTSPAAVVPRHDGHEDERAPNVDLTAHRRLAWLVDAAARNHVVEMTCLRRALTVQRMLRRRGIASQVVIGVRRDADKPLDAHAWVELGGAVLNDLPNVAQRFARLRRGAATFERDGPAATPSTRRAEG